MRRVKTERDIVMLKLLQNSQTSGVTFSRAFGVLCGAAALVLAAPIAPAVAQTGTAPAALLRVDPAPSSDSTRFTEPQRAKIRNTYAHSRKTHVNQ
jgi:hypothetical protein